jgi:hypothetical protein
MNIVFYATIDDCVWEIRNIIVKNIGPLSNVGFQLFANKKYYEEFLRNFTMNNNLA